MKALAYQPDEPQQWSAAVAWWQREGCPGDGPVFATTEGEEVPALVLLEWLRGDPFQESIEDWTDTPEERKAALLARRAELEDDFRAEAAAGRAEGRAKIERWREMTEPPALRLVTEEAPLAPESHEEERGADWLAPVDLVAIAAGGMTLPEAAFVRRTDGVGLFYPGEINSLVGEPESAKSWVALAGVVEAVRAGQRVIYLDFESDAVSVVGRLLALGLPAEGLRQIVYLRLDSPLASVRDQFAALVREFAPSWVVIDGVAEAMMGSGLDENSNRDSGIWFALLPRLLQAAGAGVVMIDHVTKASDGRGNYARGASHKKGGITGSSIGVEVVLPFGRGMTGRAKLTVLKDRPGGVRPQCVGGKLAGEMVLASDEDGSVVLTVEPAAEKFRPTYYMEKASRLLEGEGSNPPQRLTGNAVAEAVGGKREHVLAALRVLVEEGYVATETGARRSVIHSSVRPFREGDDSEQFGPVPEPDADDLF